MSLRTVPRASHPTCPCSRRALPRNPPRQPSTGCFRSRGRLLHVRGSSSASTGPLRRASACVLLDDEPCPLGCAGRQHTTRSGYASGRISLRPTQATRRSHDWSLVRAPLPGDSRRYGWLLAGTRSLHPPQPGRRRNRVRSRGLSVEQSPLLPRATMSTLADRRTDACDVRRQHR
jgi:hypothetical protein